MLFQCSKSLDIKLCDSCSSVGSGGRHSEYNLEIQGAPEESTLLGHFFHVGCTADLALRLFHF